MGSEQRMPALESNNGVAKIEARNPIKWVRALIGSLMEI